MGCVCNNPIVPSCARCDLKTSNLNSTGVGNEIRGWTLVFLWVPHYDADLCSYLTVNTSLKISDE